MDVLKPVDFVERRMFAEAQGAAKSVDYVMKLNVVFPKIFGSFGVGWICGHVGGAMQATFGAG